MTTIPEKIHHLNEKKAIDVTSQVPAMSCQSQQPIWEIVAEIGAQIPDKEWAKAPDDASINLKHYSTVK